jgi:hypothetical protein
MIFVPEPLVIVPPEEMVHIYPVIPASVLYVMPVVPEQLVAGPVITGTGKGFTVTAMIVGTGAEQPVGVI